MNNEKKELNPDELEQANGGAFVDRNQHNRKRNAGALRGDKSQAEVQQEFVTAAGEAGTGWIVKKVVNWFSGLFSGDD